MQRVKNAQVSVGGELVGRIGRGLMVLLAWPRATALRIYAIWWTRSQPEDFDDSDGKMNLSCLDVAAAFLVSQFTLFGDCRRGRRPSFTCGGPDQANALYEQFVQGVRALWGPCGDRRIQADMDVSLVITALDNHAG